MTISLFTYPDAFPRSVDHRVAVDGRSCTVLRTEAADIVQFALEGSAEICIERLGAMPHHAVLRPLAREQSFVLTDRELRFDLKGPGHWVVEFDEDWTRPLYLFAEPMRVMDPPQVSGPLRRFAAGLWHRPDAVELAPGESLWIEPGAVLEAPVLAKGCSGNTLAGPGILLGSFQTSDGVRGIMDGTRRPTLEIARCTHITLRDLLVLDTRAWSSVCLASTDVTFDNHKSVSWSISDDGLDIVGSERVKVRNSFIRSRDDCISLKACRYDGFLSCDGSANVVDIEITSSLFINADCGNALEVGFDSHCLEMRNIRFHDCDVLRTMPEGNRSGAALSIHAGNEAEIHRILFENIRIEHALEKLIDVAIFESPYTAFTGLGQVHDVVFRDIRILGTLLPRSFVLAPSDEYRIRDLHIGPITMSSPVTRSLLNTNHGIPTTAPALGVLDVTRAAEMLTVTRHASVTFHPGDSSI